MTVQRTRYLMEMAKSQAGETQLDQDIELNESFTKKLGRLFTVKGRVKKANDFLEKKEKTSRKQGEDQNLSSDQRHRANVNTIKTREKRSANWVSQNHGVKSTITNRYLSGKNRPKDFASKKDPLALRKEELEQLGFNESEIAHLMAESSDANEKNMRGSETTEKAKTSDIKRMSKADRKKLGKNNTTHAGD